MNDPQKMSNTVGLILGSIIIEVIFIWLCFKHFGKPVGFISLWGILAFNAGINRIKWFLKGRSY